MQFITKPPPREEAFVFQKYLRGLRASDGVEPCQLVKPAASKIKLEQVRPDSAFCNSEISSGTRRKPRDSMRTRVRGNEAGKTMAPRRASALAAWGSAGSTSIQSCPVKEEGSNQERLASRVFLP